MTAASLFVDDSDTIYFGSPIDHFVGKLEEQNFTSLFNISTTLPVPSGVFVMDNGDIFYESGDAANHYITKWDKKMGNASHVLQIMQRCDGLFVSSAQIIFCSIADQHKVIQSVQPSNSTAFLPVAGTGSNGSSASQLSFPHGIYVTDNDSLYVADSGNDRIQFFAVGQSSARTVAGHGTTNTITLNCPVAIALDSDEHLFIVDQGNHRVIGSNSDGFRCIIGCQASDQLMLPTSLGFDRTGNLIVLDAGNNHLQKFFLHPQSCGKASLTMLSPREGNHFLTVRFSSNTRAWLRTNCVS
jgi:hypothetical protein